MPVNYTLPPDTRAVGTPDPAGDMNNVIDALKAVGATYNVLNASYAGGADPTGTSDCTAAIQAAVNALPAAPYGGAVVLPDGGTYRVNSTITISRPGVWLYSRGSVISYYGSGDCIRMYSTQQYTSGWGGGVLGGLIIDGTHASAGACGLHIGDIYQLSFDCTARFFQGTNSKGIWFDNQYWWAEDMTGRLFVEQNTTNLQFDNSANQSGTATGSFARTDLTVVLDAKGVGDGLVLKNTASVYGAAFRFFGNMDYSSSATQHAAITIAAPPVLAYTATNASPCVFTASGHYYGNGTTVFLTGAPTGFTNGQAYFVVNTNIGAGTFQLSATSGGAAINSSSTGAGNVETFTATQLSGDLNINVECNATNANPQPVSIKFTSSGSATGFNNISRARGIIDFGATSVGFASAVNTFGNFFFDGPVYGDGQLWRSLGLGGSRYFNGSLTSGQSVFTQGVTYGVVNTTSNITGMILQGGTTDTQLFTCENSGTGSITFAVQATSHVRNGTSCVIPPNTAMMFAWLPDQGSWYALGGAVQLDATASDIKPDGVQAAGTSALAAAADHVHPNQADLTLLLAPSGATAETFTQQFGTTYLGAPLGTALTSGTVYVSALALPAGVAVNNISLRVGNGAFTGVTHGWYALLDSGRVVRAVSADQTGGNWGSTFATVTLSVSGSAYTTPAAGLYYVAWCATFTGSGEFVSASATVGGAGSIGVTLMGTSSTGQTTPPSTGTTLASISASANGRFYAYTS